MPCNDGGRPFDWCPHDPNLTVSKDVHEATVKRLDEVTQLLCNLMGELEVMRFSKMMNGHQRLAADLMGRDPKLLPWWENHKAVDIKRKDLEHTLKLSAEMDKLTGIYNKEVDKVNQIETLGGVPGAKLLKKVADAEANMKAFVEVNPGAAPWLVKKKAKQPKKKK